MINACQRFCFLWIALIFSVLAGGYIPGAAAQNATPASSSVGKSVEWTRYDVELDLHADGLLHVTEREEVAFHDGPFTSGFATIPLRNIESIDGVRVGEESTDGQVTPYTEVASDATTTSPNTYRVQTSNTQVDVDWWFAPTTDSDRTFILEYDVRGALRNGTEEGIAYQEIWWIAISSEVTAVAPVWSSTVTLRLPNPVDPESVLISPNGYVPATSGEWSVWTWQRSDLATEDQFVIRLRFPAIIPPLTEATPVAG